MKLGTKVLLVIVGSWLFMASAIYVGSLRALENSYIALENQQASENFTAASEAIQGLIDVNDTSLLSWATWDDMYQYALDKNKKFEDTNFTQAVLALYKIDLLFVYNNKSEIIFAKQLSPDKSEFVPINNDLLNLFNINGSLRKLIVPPEENHVVKGLIAAKNNIYVLSSHNILPTSAKGPSRGTIMFVIHLNDDVWKKLAASAKIDMTIYPLTTIQDNKELNNIYLFLLKNNTYQNKSNKKTLYLYSLVKDINNQPLAIVKINMPRDIRNTGAKTIFYFNIAFFITGIIFSLLLYFLLQILVIKRLVNINKKVVKIAKTHDFTIRMPPLGTDELGYIGNEMNKMLAIVDAIEIFLNDIINSMPSALAIINKNMLVTNLNSLAEKELKTSASEAKNKSLFELFPYLNKYQDTFLKSLQNNSITEIQKIAFNTPEGTQFFNVVMYPLTHSSEKSLAVRIDNITERIKINQRFLQSDKLASIGVLTAGVAHEINDPISFISSAVIPLKKNIDTILNVLEKYSKLHPDVYFSKKLKEIQQLKEVVDFESTIHETDKLLDGVHEGANRIAIIVRDLKAFSRLDEDAIKKANIHEGIDSALTLLKHNYKDRIEILKEYAAIPEIDCCPGKLNQVFMNIISNAIDAMPKKGEIHIKTELLTDEIKISIRDTGCGFKQENVTKIFNPFFTTKDVGKGAGLGLSISASIIQDHKGTLKATSEVGKGSTFTIILPIRQENIRQEL